MTKKNSPASEKVRGGKTLVLVDKQMISIMLIKFLHDVKTTKEVGPFIDRTLAEWKGHNPHAIDFDSSARPGERFCD